MSKHDDEFEALGGVDIKTEIRLTVLIVMRWAGSGRAHGGASDCGVNHGRK